VIGACTTKLKEWIEQESLQIARWWLKEWKEVLDAKGLKEAC
jgi:hypothetical protein